MKSELTGAQSDALIDMLLDTPDMALFLQRLVDLSTTELHQAHCSLTVWRKRKPVTVCSSDAVTAALDELQYEAGQGPCMEAVRRQQIVEVLDFRTETRWPRYVSAMAKSCGTLPSPSWNASTAPNPQPTSIYPPEIGAKQQ